MINSSLIKSSWLYRKLNVLCAHLFYKKYLREIANVKVAVHVHLYYLDLLDEFIANLKNIPIPFDLFITIVDRPESDIKKIFDVFPRTKVFTVPNIGRDLAGLVEVMNRVDLSAYDVLIKFHSKKSLHTGNEQSKWRQRLIEAMIGSKKQAASTLHQFCDKKVGMVGSFEDLCFVDFEDKESSQNLYKRLNIKTPPVFFRGTMFAIRPKLLKSFTEAGMTLDDFQDGKTNYAMERVFGSICIDEGYEIVTVDKVG